jgi:hypothetical protein
MNKIEREAITFSRAMLKAAGCDVDKNGDHALFCRRCTAIENSFFANGELTGDQVRRAVAVLVPVWKEGQRNMLTIGLTAWMIKNGYGRESCERLINAVCEAAGDRERMSRICNVRWHYRQVLNGMKDMRCLSGYRTVERIMNGQ